MYKIVQGPPRGWMQDENEGGGQARAREEDSSADMLLPSESV